MGNRPFSPTTILVHEEVLKQLSEPPFYFQLRDIVDETGVSRQHVANILKRMKDLGLLEVDRGRYTAVTLKEVVKYVLHSKDNSEDNAAGKRLNYVRGVFTDEDVSMIRNYSDQVLFAQQNRYEDYVTFKQNWIRSLETARAALLKELRFVRTHSSTKREFEDETIVELIESAVERDKDK